MRKKKTQIEKNSREVAGRVEELLSWEIKEKLKGNKKSESLNFSEGINFMEYVQYRLEQKPIGIEGERKEKGRDVLKGKKREG